MKVMKIGITFPMRRCVGYWGVDHKLIPCPKVLRDEGHHPHNIKGLNYAADWDKMCTACLNTGFASHEAIEARRIEAESWII